MSAATDLHPAGAVAVQPGGRKARLKNVIRRAASVTATALVVVALAGLLLLAIGPRFLDYQTSTMLTGSMSPLIKAGDVVVTTSVPTAEIRVGDVITYAIPVENHRTVTHRVTEILTDDDGHMAIRTKGDANPTRDYWTAVLSGESVDRHVFTIPHLGTVIRTLREPILLNALLYGAPTIFVVWFLISTWKKPKAKSETAERELQAPKE